MTEKYELLLLSGSLIPYGAQNQARDFINVSLTGCQTAIDV